MVVTPLDLAQHFSKIDFEYKKRSGVVHWKIFSVETKVGSVIITVPNGTDLVLLADCIQECLPIHGIVVNI